jgi:hypothetical protein
MTVLENNNFVPLFQKTTTFVHGPTCQSHMWHSYVRLIGGANHKFCSFLKQMVRIVVVFWNLLQILLVKHAWTPGNIDYQNYRVAV